MSSRHSSPPLDQTAASSQGGCLSGFLIPPLSVICVGALLAFIWLSAGPVSTLAAAPGKVEASFTQDNPVQTNQSESARQGQAGAISSVFQPSVQYWGSSIQAWAAAEGLDPNLVATVMTLESCGDPNARSGAGAMGLFQVMPFHFAEGDDPYNPDTNAARGMAYLSRSLKAANGDARLALAGYNGGIGVIGRSESSWAAETQRYAYWGSGIYSEVSNGATEISMFQEWLAAGGASFCRRAASRLGINP
jgi:soluble lytic murein transglycosylase-like protein